MDKQNLSIFNPNLNRIILEFQFPNTAQRLLGPENKIMPIKGNDQLLPLSLVRVLNVTAGWRELFCLHTLAVITVPIGARFPLKALL